MFKTRLVTTLFTIFASGSALSSESSSQIPVDTQPNLTEKLTKVQNEFRPYSITENISYDFGLNFGYSHLKSIATDQTTSGAAGGVQANLIYYPFTDSNFIALKAGLDVSMGYYRRNVDSPSVPGLTFSNSGTLTTTSFNLLLESNPWKELYISIGAGIGYGWFKESMDYVHTSGIYNIYGGDFNHYIYKGIISGSYRINNYALVGIKYEYTKMDFLQSNNISVFLTIPH